MSRFLLVDDDASLLKALRIGLSARGDEVLTAHSGAEAVDQVALTTPDLVILDLGLPDLDGIEVCRRIRSFSAVPIVVLSAYGDERRKVEALLIWAATEIANNTPKRPRSRQQLRRSRPLPIYQPPI